MGRIRVTRILARRVLYDRSMKTMSIWKLNAAEKTALMLGDEPTRVVVERWTSHGDASSTMVKLFVGNVEVASQPAYVRVWSEKRQGEVQHGWETSVSRETRVRIENRYEHKGEREIDLARAEARQVAEKQAAEAALVVFNREKARFRQAHEIESRKAAHEQRVALMADRAALMAQLAALDKQITEIDTAIETTVKAW